MSIFQAFVLGIIQGVTEYIPVSSTAHLILVPHFLGWKFSESDALVFDILVQMGTLFGVFVYFAKDIWSIACHTLAGLRTGKPLAHPEARLGWLIVLATIPAGAAGLLLKDYVEAYFASPKAVLYFLLLTAMLLIVAELFGKLKRHAVTTNDAIIMGVAQIIALLPGVSRSGSTISAGMLSGLSRDAAARFSFLMSIPVMVGAGLIATKDWLEQSTDPSHLALPLLVGTVTAALSGYLVIKWFLKFLKTQSLLWFALYCALLGGLGIIFYG